MRVPWDGFEGEPRKWQREALTVVLEALKNRVPGLVSAIMGSGKSRLQAEIGWMALERLGDRAIVYSAPTQDLVRQLGKTISARCGPDNVGHFYADAKEDNRRIVVACNDSLLPLALRFKETGRKVALCIPDECHGVAARSMEEALDSLNPLLLCGFTATPFRSIPKERLSRFKEVLFRYTMQEALRDKVLVPIQHIRYVGTNPGSVDHECLEMMLEHGDGPGIVSANSIEDCERYAAWLTERGFPAMPIHSRMNGLERARRLEALHEGGVRCLVHVSLLSEGVDLPWLMWLCLRRKTEARVRFLQEVGRVCRTHPGKTVGKVMDPHLLLGKHGLTTAEAIGEALEQAALAEGEEAPVKDERGLTEVEVVALDALLHHLSQLHEALLSSKFLRQKDLEEEVVGRRLAPVTQKQVDALAKVRKMTRHIPKEHRETVKALIHVPWALTRGNVSDILDILYTSSRWARGKGGEKAFMLQWPKRYACGVESADSELVHRVNKIKVLDD